MKKVFVAILVALLLGGTALAFSWWDNLSREQNETLQIGEGVTLVVTAVATAPADKVLVPAGVTMTADDVDQIQLTYNVNLDQTVIDPLTLSVVATNVLIGGSSTYADLINIDITQAATTVNDANVLVTVTVSLDMPSTQAIYDEIKNGQITFSLTFTGE
ncbi:MAG TPA: hypothetical protein PLH02_05140 [Bacillota bacterium]|nr:hypothetical protein [Bacillota bacterium]HPJ86156.1 hypothetical protein [Bacillota bacterium]HPQ62233.1 hypothetical protein [Bacillota bacterium]